uniref:Uncharacterized protein n=1 Tax=Arundo donax TaxID=35708 RepID=A0A0A8ZXS9_ARUDO
MFYSYQAHCYSLSMEFGTSRKMVMKELKVLYISH